MLYRWKKLLCAEFDSNLVQYDRVSRSEVLDKAMTTRTATELIKYLTLRSSLGKPTMNL